MKLEIDKFYVHNAGKMIYIHGEVDTYAWGKMLIVEECCPTVTGVEHYISVIVKDNLDHSGNYTEIGEAEFKRNFPKVNLRKAKAGLN